MSSSSDRPLRVLFFGTFDTRAHPRVLVLQEGLAALGEDVRSVNVPLGLDTAWRVRILQRPWLVPVLAVRLLAAWSRLWWRARRLPQPDVVVVGYMGHFDIHLARRLWPKVPRVLDHLLFAGDTAADRGVERRSIVRLLERLDLAALRAADLVLVDTDDHLATMPDEVRDRGLTVAVGAPQRWFGVPDEQDRDGTEPLRIVFFGLYTPLQGAVHIGAALRMLAEAGVPFAATMVGHGQQLQETQAEVGDLPQVRWERWVDAEVLPALVARHDVCLGVFGTSPKARRVVPNKVFQGAAAGCVVVTSDTPPQRRALGDAAVYVPPGDAPALCAALRDLAGDRQRLDQARRRSRERALEAFEPPTVTAVLQQRLHGLAVRG